MKLTLQALVILALAPLTEDAESSSSMTGTGRGGLESWMFPARPETMGAKKTE